MITSFTASNPSFALLPWMPLILLIKLVDHCFKHPRKKRLAHVFTQMFQRPCCPSILLRWISVHFVIGMVILPRPWAYGHSGTPLATGLLVASWDSVLESFVFIETINAFYSPQDRYKNDSIKHYRCSLDIRSQPIADGTSIVCKDSCPERLRCWHALIDILLGLVSSRLVCC